MKSISEQIQIMIAADEGEQIEKFPVSWSPIILEASGRVWGDFDHSKEAFNWRDYDYRVKVKRSISDLPRNTLIRIGNMGDFSNVYTDTKNRVFINGVSSFTSSSSNSGGVASLGDHAEWQVIENPPAMWFGGECPLPDWVVIRVFLRDQRIREDLLPSDLSWSHTGESADIIGYQILGEVDNS